MHTKNFVQLNIDLISCLSIDLSARRYWSTAVAVARQIPNDTDTYE